MNPLLNSPRNGGPSLSELRAMAESNPQVKALLAMHNGDAKGAFFALCRQRGVDPNSILSRLK